MKGRSVRKIPMTSTERSIHEAAKRVQRAGKHRDVMIRIGANEKVQQEAVREWLTALSDLAIVEAKAGL